MRNFFPLIDIRPGLRILVSEIWRHIPSYELIVCESTPVRASDITVVEDHTDWLVSFVHDGSSGWFNPGEDCESLSLRGQVFGLGRVVGVRTHKRRQTVAIAGVGKAYEPETSWRYHETTSATAT